MTKRKKSKKRERTVAKGATIEEQLAYAEEQASKAHTRLMRACTTLANAKHDLDRWSRAANRYARKLSDKDAHPFFGKGGLKDAPTVISNHDRLERV